MIKQSILKRSLAQQSKFCALTQVNNRAFAGGGNKPKAIDPKTTDYDIVFIGKCAPVATVQAASTRLRCSSSRSSTT